jgi:copper homeostasis protein
MTVLVEACVDSVASALAAERGGAGRLELCDNLFDGGTTPSAGMISGVKAAVRIPVFVIVRPRGGGFVYSDDEISIMRVDIEAARMLGADGVVIGALTRDARVDAEQLHALVAAAADLPMTFHRAFDFVRDQSQALETLIQHNVSRVLTSGGAPTALGGVGAIASLARRAANQIEVMAGGGVRGNRPGDRAAGRRARGSRPRHAPRANAHVERIRRSSAEATPGRRERVGRD